MNKLLKLINRMITCDKKKQQKKITTFVLMILCCMFSIPNTLPIIYPVHNPLQQVPTTTKCYPDQVLITKVSNNYDGDSSLYLEKCIKCTEFSSMAQQCQIYSIRRGVMAVKITKRFFDQTTTFRCNSENGYTLNTIKSAYICVDKVITPALFNDEFNDVSCYGNPNLDGCYDCNVAYSCDRCGYGYYLKSNTNTSKKQCFLLNTTPNNYCLKAQNQNPLNCQACQPQYYLSNPSGGGSDQICFKCPTNCIQCYKISTGSTLVTCTKCKQGYQYPSNNCTQGPLSNCPIEFSTCKQCITCTSPSGQQYTQCISCNNPSTQFLNRQATRCTTNCTIAQPHCQTCYTSKIDNLPKCRKCKQGFYVNWHGGCQSCQAPIPYCAKCQNSGKCTQCMMQMAYIKTDTQCELCSVKYANCLKCEQNTSGVVQCLKCSQGFYVDSSKRSCQPCISQCRACVDGGTCISCKIATPINYLDLNDNKCKTCQNIIPDCGQCNTQLKNAQCLNCINNKALYKQPITGKMICGPCSRIDINCITCKKGNLCTGCQPTSKTYLQLSSNTCQPCIPPCQTCSTKHKCLTCLQKYLVIVDTIRGKCEQCQKHIPNCQQCIKDAALGFLKCAKCKSTYILETNINAGTNINMQCLPCPQGEYPVYGPPDRCDLCIGKCSTCHNATTCKSCAGVYYTKIIAYNIVECIDLCGDQIIIDRPCDLWKGNISDGCTSDCQVQKDFICQLYYSKNNLSVSNQNDKVALQQYIDLLPKTSTQHYYSICSYNGSVQMTINQITKQIFENKITFQIGLVPFLHAYKQLTQQEINSLITATYKTIHISQDKITTKLSPHNQTLIVTIFQQHSFLQPLTLTLTHDNVTTDKRKFKYTTNSFIQANTKDVRSLSAFYYTQGDLKLWRAVYMAMQGVSIFALICAFGSILLKNLAGIELLWIMQSMYISLFWYQQPLSLPLFSLAGLSISNGYNAQSQVTRPYLTQTVNSTRLLYTYKTTSGNFSSIFVQIPYMVVLFILLYFFSYVGWVCKDTKNPKVKRLSKHLQQFFYSDGLLIVAMFMLLYLLNQAFLLKQNWTVVGLQSQFYGLALTFFGLCCQFMIVYKWFKTKHLGYEKVQQGIIPYEIFFSPFSRHNFPILRQKFYSLYIIFIILASILCAFGGFYPMMPSLLYLFLAFLIGFYEPYRKTLSNYRTIYYSLVIGYGYFLRVIYLFSYQEDSSTINGIVEHNLWTIWIWIVGLVIAFALFFIDVTSTYRENQKQRQKLQQQFKQNLQRQNKQFQMRMLEQEVKKYQSHKGNIQSIIYPNFDEEQKNKQKKNIVSSQKQQRDREDKKLTATQIKRKVNQSGSNINSKQNATMINNNKKKDKYTQAIYSSINNNYNKNKTKRAFCDDLKQVMVDQQTLGNKQWLLDRKKAIDQQKFRKQQQKLDGQLKLAYKIIGSIFQAKQQIINQRKTVQSQMSIKERLVKYRVEEQYDKHYNNPDIEQKPQIELQQMYDNKNIKQEHLDKYKLQKKVDKHKPICSRERNFPKVEIYYQKAQKISEKQLKQMEVKQQKQKRLKFEKDKNKINKGQQQSLSLSSQTKKLKLKQLKSKLKIMTIEEE